MRLALAFGIMLTSAGASFAHDIVIAGGRVIDPETGLDAIRNVAIDGDKIVAISEFALDGDVVIDARGHVVSPGFIDMHSHGQNIGDYRMQVIQGVTTALELESGLVPIGDWYDGQAKKNLPMNYGASAGWIHSRIATFSGTDPLATVDYFQDAQGRTDWKSDIATPEQSERIMSMVEQGLKDGALGIGVNAGYAPGYGHKEYLALAELAKKYNVPTYTHVRYASNTEPQSSFEAIQELISLAAITGAHMHHATSIRPRCRTSKPRWRWWKRRRPWASTSRPRPIPSARPAPSSAQPCSAVRTGAARWLRPPTTFSSVQIG